MTTIAGVAAFKVDGKSYESTGEWSITIGGEVLTALPMGSSNVYSSKEMHPGKISGNIATTVGLSVTALKNSRNITVQVQAANGSLYILRNAFFTGEGEVTTKDGTFAVEFQGPEVIQA